MKQRVLRLTSMLVILSLILNNFIFGNLAIANVLWVDMCTPTVTSATGPGITNFTIGSINNTTAIRPGGVAYNDYTNPFTPPLVTKGDTLPYSFTYTSATSGYATTIFVLDDGYITNVVNNDIYAGSFTVNSSTDFVNNISQQKTGPITVRTSISSSPLATYLTCTAADGEIEDYRLLLQGATPSVNLYPSNQTTFVREGGRTDTFDVQLDTKPTQNVTVNLTPGSRFTLSQSSFTFTPSNWYVHQSVTATAVNDGLSNGQADQLVSYTTTSSDGGYNGLSGSPLEVQVIDNDSFDDSSVEIHLFSTSTANNSGPDYAKVSGITSFGEFTDDNFFGPTDSTDVSVPIARRYNFSNSMTSVLMSDIDPELTTLTSPTVLSLSDDELTSDIALPFDVMMYGQAMRHLEISSNGILYLGATSIQVTDTGNAPPYDGPSAIDLENATHFVESHDGVMIAALWSDLTPASAGGAGTISYGVEGTAPNRTFIVYYNDVSPYDASGSGNTVQVKLFETAVNPSAEVTVTAVVDPVISFTLTPSVCSLGSLSSSEVKTCQFGIEVETNAAGGYTATIKDANNGSLLSGANTILSSSTTLSSGTAGFGITSSSATGNITNNATCTNASTRVVTGITSSDQIIVEGSEPTLSESTTICVGAIITDTTPAGSYSDVATVTVVGNF